MAYAEGIIFAFAHLRKAAQPAGAAQCRESLGLLSSLIVFAYSRRREYAADAGSAKLLGSPFPMIAALRRLGNLQPGTLPSSLMPRARRAFFLSGMSQYSELTKRALLSYPIVGVLSALGKRTDRPAGHGFFFSPFREERHPSFQINESANVWTDWGTGDKGGVLDLVCRLKGCSRPDAMDFLASLSPAMTRFIFRHFARKSVDAEVPSFWNPIIVL